MTVSAGHAILYRATSAVSGNCYIGITTKSLRRRAKLHRDAAGRGRGACIGAAIRKYGKQNIMFEALVVCPDWDYAKEMERRAIEIFRPAYNLTKGGDGCVGYRHTTETRERIRQANLGSKHWLGKKHTPETRKKMKQARTAYWDRVGRVVRINRPRPPKDGREVIDLSTGASYRSVMEASRATGQGRGMIRWRISRGVQFAYVAQTAAAA